MQETKLCGAKAPRLRLLLGACREDDDLRAQLRRELDRKVAQSTNAKYADSIARLDRGHECRIDRGARTLQRRGRLRLHSVRDAVEERLRPDIVLAQRAEVEVLFSVDVALVAPDVAAGEAVPAVAAGTAVVAAADAVAGPDLRDGLTDLHHHANALVAERSARAEEVHVGAAEARVRDLDEHLGWFERGQLDGDGRGVSLDAAEDVVRG